VAERIVHLTTPEEWAVAQGRGEVVPAGFATEGFVHCSTPRQVPATIERHFDEVDELVLLELDVDAVTPDVRWEEGRPGEVFPHLYRPIAVEEVLRAVPWHRAGDGGVTLPDELA
jgi:uncharacterized protein (DUF952 family)